MKRKLGSKRKEALTGLLFISPWLIGISIFTAYPIVASMIFSFSSYNGISSPVWIGLQNFRDLFNDEIFLKSIYNTLFLAIIGIPITQFLSIITAVLLNMEIKGQSIFRTLFFLPSIVPAVASALLWKWILNPEFGPVNLFLEKLGIPGPGWLTDPLWSKPSLIILSCWGIGGAMIIYLAGLQNIPKNLYEAAEIDGASKIKSFFKITLPMLKPVIIFNLVMGIISSFQVFTNVFIMTSGGPENSTEVYALQIYRNAFQYYKMGYASAMSWILLIITAFSVFLVFKFFKNWGFYGGDL